MWLRALVLCTILTGLFAQAPAPKSVLGTISAFRAESAEIEIKPEVGAALSVKVTGSTLTKKVAPGQTDLSKAESINATDVAIGDRVLVTLSPDGTEARRIIVIAADDLAKRAVTDRADWTARGVSGVVTAVTGNDIAVELRSLGGATKYTVTVNPKTSFRKYAPDSVKFADARPATLTEVAAGDQLRARGQKSVDGLKVDAEEVVFGTFLSKAGTISSVDSSSHQVTIKDLANNKPLIVKFLAESQIKRMPDVAAAQGMMAGGRGGPPAAPAPSSAPQAAGRGAGPGPGRGGGPDVSQMIEKLPTLKLEDLKPNEVIVVSAISGATPDRITAITFLANAETLVQLAMAARGANATGPAPSLAGLAGSISSVGP